MKADVEKLVIRNTRKYLKLYREFLVIIGKEYDVLFDYNIHRKFELLQLQSKRKTIGDKMDFLMEKIDEYREANQE
jgi:hypothetical protein